MFNGTRKKTKITRRDENPGRNVNAEPQTGNRYRSSLPSSSNRKGSTKSWTAVKLKNAKAVDRSSASLPLTWRVLATIVGERDADLLVVALSTRPGWTLLLESEFQLTELRVMFSALKKCSQASSLDLLRRFMSNTLGTDKFVTRCCLLLPAIRSDEVGLVEDVVSVLETSASLQPAGLAKPCMLILCSLESNRTMASWNEASELDLFAKIKATRQQLTAAANATNACRTATSRSKIYKGYRTSGVAPESFRDMSILPTQKDLEEEHPFLRPNIIEGAYESLEDYFDVQFRLLREDYVTPLRDGLREFKGIGSEFCRNKLRAIKDVRFYPGVYYQRPQDSSQYSILAAKERITLLLATEDFRRVNWHRSKRFTNGALIGISKDKFETIIFATVSNRDPEALQYSGILTLELCVEEDLLEFRPGIEFSLVESSGAYFEAYRHNLAVMQSMTEMPFSRHLVSAEKDVRPPSFLSDIINLDLSPILKKFRRIRTRFPLHKWPQVEDTILNKRQFEAVKSAFSNELCVIQGPPGTGKTFIGLKIVELMLKNNVTAKPFLIVCYTNHALDQFVEGISKFTTEIVRLGGRCSSEELEKFTLRKLRRDQPRLPNDYELRNLRTLLWELRDERTSLMTLLENIEATLATLQGRAIFEECDAFGPNFMKRLNLDRIEHIVMPDELGMADDEGDGDGNLSDEDRGQVEEEEVVVRKRCNNRKEAAIKKLLGSHNQRDQPSNQFDSLAYTKYKFDRRRQYIIDMKRNHPDAPFDLPPHLEMELAEWWQLYRDEHWKRARDSARRYINACRGRPLPRNACVSSEELEKLHQPPTDDIDWTIRCLSSRLTDVRLKLLQNMAQSSEAESHLDFEIIKNSKIIGVTTTGAAKFNTLLRKVDCEVVVAEEAAEVLEAHLITTLSPSTKQLILIGDHQQLQPSTTVYKLATSFNLQVSLFERLIKNGMPYVRLQEQHRMRDQFLKLLVPTIYADYFSHRSVFKYENVRGLSQNLFFVTHAKSEESEGENSSKSNLFEAEFVACLALYLRMQGYDPTQIVILTTYSGQVFAIRNVIRNIEQQRHWTGMKTVFNDRGVKSRVPVREGLPISMFEGIRITTVDNYQGEESDIVIASFVRSNDDERIGFLSRDNRVCVALSRAKKGFYCIGNLAMLARASRTWENISRVLLDGNLVNKGLELFCEVHEFRKLASTCQDFDEMSDGGCTQPCGGRLNCGHTCPKTCHKLDADHSQFLCERDCERTRPCNHPCPWKCHQACGRCTTNVIKQLPCGHQALAECYKSSKSIECGVVVKKRLIGCTHTPELECHLPIDEFSCQEPCERSMPCGVHRCVKLCFDKCGQCMEFVDTESPCGHVVRLVCRDSKDEINLRQACDTKVEVQLPCGHKNMVSCREKDSAAMLPEKCEQPTEVSCSSGHSLTVKCPIKRSEKVDEYCLVKTRVSLHCGHEIMRPCNKTRNFDLAEVTAGCKKIVKVASPCGHEVEVPCNKKTGIPSKVLANMCRVPIDETLSCGHSRTRKCYEKKECAEKVTVLSSCGHNVVTLCSRKGDDEFTRTQCSTRCNKTIQCGHRCTGTCCARSGNEFHQKCLKMCKKTLFCGHECLRSCHSQCNPCQVKEKLSCPHSTKFTECLSSINEPCTRTPLHCAHVLCEAANCSDCHCFCDSRCQRSLPCQSGSQRRKKSRGTNHRCVGLCSELCVCSICDGDAINAAVLPRGVNRKEARFIKLPCNHIFEVSWFDNYIREHKDFLSFPRCPKHKCWAQLRLMRRYHKILERIRLNMREVYNRVFGDLKEMKAAHQELFNECQPHRSETKKSSEDPGRGQQRSEIIAFVDKVLKLSKTPSRFVLDYLRLLLLIINEDMPSNVHHLERRSEVIASEELQLQLLSDCVVAGNKERVAKGLSPRALLDAPVSVGKWSICDQNHVFSSETKKRCPDCSAVGKTLVEMMTGIDL